MTVHTPGPWKWLNYPDGRKLLAAPSRAVIHCADAPLTIDEADQALIAAAPDLLAALKNMADDAEAIAANSFDNHQQEDPDGYQCLQQARAAIAKAEGRS